MTTGGATGDEGLSGQHRQDADEPVAVRRGLDRRTLIKRAAAAGAVAWTAPVIFDSLASPAAAGTCGAIFRVTANMTNAGLCNAVDVVQSSAAYKGNGPYATSVQPPSQYTETVSDLPASLTFAQTCITLTGSGLASCGADKVGETVTATLIAACTPSSGVTGCSTPLAFLAAQLSVNGGTFSDVCVQQVGSGSNGFITSLTSASVSFLNPPSTKPGHSGSYQFVVGCSCTS